jgi:hypothetical protein
LFVLHSHVLAYVPNSVMKDILTQPDPEGKRGKCIATLLEYEVEINLTKLVKRPGLAQMMDQSNFELLGVNVIVDLTQYIEEEASPQVSKKKLDSYWYNEIIFVL